MSCNRPFCLLTNMHVFFTASANEPSLQTFSRAGFKGDGS